VAIARDNRFLLYHSFDREEKVRGPCVGAGSCRSRPPGLDKGFVREAGKGACLGVSDTTSRGREQEGDSRGRGKRAGSVCLSLHADPGGLREPAYKDVDSSAR